jgi:glycosyltransferase involved in cell wall biosynthesis
MMKIAYDAQAFLSSNGGTGKGSQLKNLLGPYADQFVGFASTDPNPSGLPLVQEGLSGYTAWQQFSLPRSLKRHGARVFLSPYNVAPFFLPRSIDLVLVLHDLILMQGFRKRDPKGRLMDAYRRWQIPHSVRRARIVLTVSEHSRTEILKRFPHANVHVIPCTLPEQWFAPTPLQGRAGYLLMTTSSAPHKNAKGALKAYARYVQQAGAASRPLRIVGLGSHARPYKELLTWEGISGKATFLPFQSESELIAQYQSAAALLFPSFSEGFGIPMLEAMATGTPVLASNCTSLPEVGGSAARYFNPHSLPDMAAALYEVLGDDTLRATMAERGLIEIQRYAPARVRQQVIHFWEEIAGIPTNDHAPFAHPLPASSPA